LDYHFDTNKDSNIELTAEATHSTKRIYYVKNATDKAIQQSLSAHLLANPKIQVIDNYYLLDLLIKPQHNKNPKATYGPTQVFGTYLLKPDNSINVYG
jgi:aspartate oxidase